MFYTLHVVEPLRYDSVLIKETNEMKANWTNFDHTCQLSSSLIQSHFWIRDLVRELHLTDIFVLYDLTNIIQSSWLGLNTLSTGADVQGTQKVLSNNGFIMANCFCCLSQNAYGVPWSLPSRITTKVLKNCKTFSPRPRSRPRPNVQDQDQVFHFCPWGASRPRSWYRGLHHCMTRPGSYHAVTKTDRYVTTQHQICKTKTKTIVYKTRPIFGLRQVLS